MPTTTWHTAKHFLNTSEKVYVLDFRKSPKCKLFRPKCKLVRRKCNNFDAETYLKRQGSKCHVEASNS